MSFESQQSLLFFPRYSLLIYHLEREKKNHNYRIFFWRETQHTTPEEGATDTEKVREGRRRRGAVREKKEKKIEKKKRETTTVDHDSAARPPPPSLSHSSRIDRGAPAAKRAAKRRLAAVL